MPSFWGAFSSSSASSSSPSQAEKPPLKGKSNSSNDMYKSSGGYEQKKKKKLTRQRKLRYLTDEEVGLVSAADAPPQFFPGSPDEEVGLRTPPHGGAAVGHRSNLAVPQPLPLPELILQCSKQKDKPNVSSASRNSIHQNLRKTTDDAVLKPRVSRRRGFPRDLNVDTAQNDSRLHFPAKSAPASGISSPDLTSQRYNTVDLFHPSFQVSTALKGSTSDRISYHVSPILSPDHSPRHIPLLQNPHELENSKTSNCTPVHSHHKTLSGCSATRSDNSVANVYPLPRPRPLPWPSPTIHQSVDRLDSFSVKGQWQRGKLLGRGTYGSVYVATHCESGATCAVKEVEIVPDDPKFVECVRQLEQEIKLLRELKHPNIVQYYGSEIIEDRLCIYLEYVHPGSINKYVREHCGAMTESIVRSFTRHILSGLAYLHSTRTIHRDIKGANLLVDASGVVKLADFGLAKHLAGNHVELSLKGTPHWMAPEVLQAVMRSDANPELACGVDIWSVGCTVIEMLTGKPPWSEGNRVQAMFNVLNKAPPIPQTLSAEGKDFLQCCFQRKPEDRPCANKLLEHAFLRSSQDQNSGGLVQEFARMRIPDIHSPSGWTRRGKDVVQPSPGARIQHRKSSFNSETNQLQSCPESSDAGAAISHHSPRSTLEVRSSTVSSPELNRGSNRTSPSNINHKSYQHLQSGKSSSSVLAWKGSLIHCKTKMTDNRK